MGVAIGGSSGTGPLGTLLLLIKPFIGAGLLSLPATVQQAGVLAFFGFLVVLTYVAGWCIFKLVECASTIELAETRRNMQLRILRQRYQEQHRDPNDIPTIPLFQDLPGVTDNDIIQADRALVTTPTFTEIGSIAFGRIGELIVDISIIITQLGACIAYVIFISGAMYEVTNLPKWAWICILLIPMFLLSCVRNMENLAPAASLGNLVYIYTIVVIFYQGFAYSCCVPTADIKLSDFSYYPTVFGSLSFALEGIALVLPIRHRMKNQKQFSPVMTTAFILLFIAYLGFSVLSYLFYGDATQSPVISNLRPGLLTDSVKISLSISLFFTYGLQCYPVSTFFDEVWDKHLFKLDFHALRKEKHEAHGHLNEHGRSWTNNDLIPSELHMKRFIFQTAQRFAFTAFVCFLAFLIPKFQLVIALFGSFSNALLAYILPALFWMRICTHQLFTGRAWFPYDRKGQPNPTLQLPTSEDDSDYYPQADISVLSNDEESVLTSGRPSALSYGTDLDSLQPGSPSSQSPKLVLASSHHSVNDNSDVSNIEFTTQKALPQKVHPLIRFFWLAFPVAVSILGTLASIVGVIFAMRDLIDAIEHKT